MNKVGNFSRFGIMLDCSRNGVMKVEKIKFLLDCMQKMGYNALELYSEDVYEVEGEPYFGYMRGRYTGEELKCLDAYAQSKGIELIPCVQTLAHFTAFVKNDEVYDMVDTADILLIGSERTYQFIDRLFASLAKNFTSREVNIGMDEAHMVGLGKYLDKNGYKNRFDILLEHLHKVAEIAAKYGFKAHMWSDMFFRFVNNGAYCSKDVINVPEQVKKSLPDNVDLVYWDYYQVEKSAYDVMFESHKGFNSDTWFAGSAWCQYGFAPYHTNTLRTMRPALESANEHGVKNVLITLWGDNGRECSPFTLLPAMYTLTRYAEGFYEQSSIEAEFKQLFGYDYSDFVLLELPNKCKPNEFDNAKKFWNPCKSLLYTDAFMGLMDSAVKENEIMPFEEYALLFREKAKVMGEFSYLYNFMEKLCGALAIKATLGVKTREVYESKNKQTLLRLIDEYKELVVRVEKFHEAFYELWMTDNKPQGWEIQDVRLGGLICRLNTCIKRLTDYYNGKISKIEELEEPVLSYMHGLANHNYELIVSRSVL